MKVAIDVDERYPDFYVRPARREELESTWADVFDVARVTYAQWARVQEAYERMQKEVTAAMEEHREEMRIKRQV